MAGGEKLIINQINMPEKYYPPFYINEIQELADKTLVKVTFYECSLDEVKLAAKEGRNANGAIKEQKVFELPKMTAEQAREEIYSQLIKDKKSKREIVPETEVRAETI